MSIVCARATKKQIDCFWRNCGMALALFIALQFVCDSLSLDLAGSGTFLIPLKWKSFVDRLCGVVLLRQLDVAFFSPFRLPYQSFWCRAAYFISFDFSSRFINKIMIAKYQKGTWSAQSLPFNEPNERECVSDWTKNGAHHLWVIGRRTELLIRIER